MKRILIIAAVIAVVLAGGWAALWFVNKGEVEQRVQQALAQLERGGAPNTYEAIEISGFPMGYRATVRQLVLEDDNRSITLPAVSAEASITDLKAMIFKLPEQFELLEKGSGSLYQIDSTGLTATIADAGQDAYDIALKADTLDIASKTAGAPGPVKVAGFSASGAMIAQPDQGQVKLSLQGAAREVRHEFSSPDGENGKVSGVVTVREQKTSVDGSLEALGMDFSAASVLLEFEGDGVVELREPAYSVKATPKERFDPSLMSRVKDFQSGLEAFGAMALKGVAEGGAAEARIKFAGLQGSGAIEGKSNAADIGAFDMSVDFGAQRVGLEASGDKFLVDINLPDGSEFYYSGADFKSLIAATPAEAFDFTALQTPGPQTGEQFLLALWEQIQNGGSFEASSSAGPTVSRAVNAAGAAPVGDVESRSGPSSSRLALNPEEASLAVSIEDLGYKLAEGGPVSGEASVGKFAIDFYAPLKASPAKQIAKLRVALDEIALDDKLWSLLDPGQALQREVKGLRLSADAGMTVRRDLLSPQSDLMNLGNPAVLPDRVTIADSYLDMLGLRADLTGDVGVFPLPSGELDLLLAGWRQFFEAVQKTPLSEDPQTVSSLLIMNDLVANYGEPADPAAPGEDAQRFKIEIGGPGGLSINGKPFGG